MKPCALETMGRLVLGKAYMKSIDKWTPGQAYIY